MVIYMYGWWFRPVFRAEGGTLALVMANSAIVCQQYFLGPIHHYVDWALNFVHNPIRNKWFFYGHIKAKKSLVQHLTCPFPTLISLLLHRNQLLHVPVGKVRHA